MKPAVLALGAVLHGCAGSGAGARLPVATLSAAGEAPVAPELVVMTRDQPRSYAVAACTQVFVTPVRGTAWAGNDALSTSDVLAVRGDTFEIAGDGMVLVAAVRLADCAAAPPARAVVRATAAPELSFFKGQMHAHLDVDDRTVAPSVYLGRLSGGAAVPKHTHPGTWEVLCASEAAGTFTLAGQASRLGPGACVKVPPDVEHSWQPDPGSTLTAVQLYWPPGPEQRFKKLAADEAAAH